MIEYLCSIVLIGILIYYLLRRNIEFNKYELLLYIFIYGLFFTYLLSIILLVLGFYSGEHIKFIIIALSVIAMLIIIKQLYILRWKEVFRKVTNKIVALILMLLSIGIIVVVYDKPNEFVLHDFLDSSNYMTQAAYMNETGKYYMTKEYKENSNLGMVHEKTNFESYSKKQKSILIDGEKKKEMPFYILNKVALANALSFSNVKEVLYIPLVFLILIFLAIVSLSEKILKKSYLSILTGLIFSITPAVINNSRSTMTELITLLIIIIFLNQNIAKFNDRIKEEKTKNYNEYIGIVLFSMLFLTRSDAIFILVGVILAQNISLNYKIDTGKYKLLLVLSGIMGMISYIINPNYSNHTFNISIFKDKNIYPYLLLSIVSIGFICEHINIVNKITMLKNNLERVNNIILTVIAPIYFMFCFIFRPLLYYVFNKLGYTDLAYAMNIYPGLSIITYFGVFTFLICIFMMIKTNNTAKNEILEWGIYCFIPSSVVLAYNFMHSTHLYWASRRYIYSIMPMLVVLGIYFIKYLNNKKKVLLVVVALLAQNLLLNYNIGNINEMQKKYYIDLSNSLEQFIKQINTDKIAIYNNVENSVSLVNYINNFTNKEARLVDKTGINNILQDQYYTIIVQDLEEIYLNEDIQEAIHIDYAQVEYENMVDGISNQYKIDYKILNTYQGRNQKIIINNSMSSNQIMGYIDKLVPVNEDVYFMQGWSYLKDKNIRELILTDEEDNIISRAKVGEYRPGIDEIMGTRGADYLGWNIFFVTPDSKNIKIYLDADGTVMLFKEIKINNK